MLEQPIPPILALFTNNQLHNGFGWRVTKWLEWIRNQQEAKGAEDMLGLRKEFDRLLIAAEIEKEIAEEAKIPTNKED